MTKNSNNKCFSCIFWEDKKNTSIFKAKIFSCPPPGQNGPFFLGGGAGSMDSLYVVYTPKHRDHIINTQGDIKCSGIWSHLFFSKNFLLFTQKSRLPTTFPLRPDFFPVKKNTRFLSNMHIFVYCCCLFSL